MPTDGSLDLSELVGRLRTAGFRPNVRQYLTAHQLLLALAERNRALDWGSHGEGVETLISHLRPVFCTSPEEQARFPAIVRDWLGVGAPARPTPMRLLRPTLERVAAWIAGPLLAAALIGLLIAAPLQYWLRFARLEGVVMPPGPGSTKLPEQAPPAVQLTLDGQRVPIDAGGRFFLRLRVRAPAKHLNAQLTPPSGSYRVEPADVPVDGNTSSPIVLRIVRQVASEPAPSPPPLQEAPGYERSQEALLTPPLPPTPQLPQPHWPIDWVWAGGWAAVGAVLSLAALWVFASLRRRLVLKRLPEHGRPELHELVPKADPLVLITERETRSLVRGLRRSRRGTTISLSVERTVAASARAGGLFSPEYVSRWQMPAYLILHSRKSANDHQAKLAELMIERLVQYGLPVARYEFDDDPRVCRSPNPVPRQYRLGELVAIHHFFTLFVFAESRAFFDLQSGKLAPWVEWLQEWPRRVLFTPEPPARWTQYEWTLAATGMVVLPWSTAGLRTFADLGDDWRIDRLFPAPYARQFPPLIGGEARQWLSRAAPPETGVDKLLRQLSSYLGPDAFLVLCACAIYPQISWPLTLHLAGTAIAAPPMDSDLASTLPPLARLPWFRYAYMPDWLRLALIKQLSPQDERRLRERLEALIERLAAQAHDGSPSSRTGLDLARWIKPNPKDVISTSAPNSLMRDAVFVGFMSGASFDRLVLQAPAALRRLFKGAGEMPPAATLGQQRSFLQRLVARLRWFVTFKPGLARAALAGVAGLVLLAGGAAIFRAPEHAKPPPVPPPKIMALTISADGTAVATANSDSTIALWPVASNAQPVVLPAQQSPLMAVALSPDGKRLASAGRDNRVTLWDVDRRAPLATFQGHKGAVTAVVFSPDGTLLASASKDNSVIVWNVETRQALATLEGHKGAVTGLAFSPDGKRLASSSEDKTVILWKVDQHNALATLRGHDAPLTSISFSPDGSLAAGTRDGAVILWTDGRLAATLSRHQNVVSAVAFSADGKTLASSGSDGTVVLWDVTERKSLKPPIELRKPIVGVAFTSKGTTLAAATADSVHLWSITIRHPKSREPVITPTAPSPIPKPLSREGAKSIEVAGSTPTAQHGNLQGGKAFRDTCAAGEALIGVRYSIEPRGWLGQIGAVCGRIPLSSAAPPAVSVGPAIELPMRGLADGPVRTALCPAQQVIVGFDGRTGLLVDQLAWRCAPLTVTASTQAAVAPGRIMSQKPFGGQGGKPFPTTDCPQGQIANGTNLRAGDDVDGFGLLCGSPRIIEAPTSPSRPSTPEAGGPSGKSQEAPAAVAGTVTAQIKDNRLERYVQTGVFENTPAPEYTGAHDWTYNSWRLTGNGASVRFFLPTDAIGQQASALRLVYAGWGKQTLINLSVNGIALTTKHPVGGSAWASPQIDTFDIPVQPLARPTGGYHTIDLQLDPSSSMVLFFKEIQLLTRTAPVTPTSDRRAAIQQLAREIASLPNLLDGEAVPGEMQASTDWNTLLEFDGKTLVAARYFGKGRIFATGHEGFLVYPGSATQHSLLWSAMNWLAPTQRGQVLVTTNHRETLPIYHPKDAEKLRTILGQWGYDVLDGPDLTKLNDVAVVIIANAWGELTDSEINSLVRFVEGGGGLLVAGLGWSWQQYGPDASTGRNASLTPLQEYPMNRLMARFGLSWTGSEVHYHAARQAGLVIPYDASGYRYRLNRTAGFESPRFDDSSWSVGDAPFGSGHSCPLNETVRTRWPSGSDSSPSYLQVRKKFRVPTAWAGPLTVGVAIDNDVRVFVNGTEITSDACTAPGQYAEHENCPEHDSFVFTAPNALLVRGRDNVIAVEARDRGSSSFLDFRVALEDTVADDRRSTVGTLRSIGGEAADKEIALVSGTTTQTAGFTTVDPVSDPVNSALYSHLAWGDATVLTAPVIPPWINPESCMAFSRAGAKWISSTNESQGNEHNLLRDSWRLYRAPFRIPPGSSIASAEVTVSADNAFIVYLNGVATTVGTSGDVYGAPPKHPTSNFQKVYSYSFAPSTGANTLYFVVRNWDNSSSTDNPSGLLYKAIIRYKAPIDPRVND